MGCDRLMMSVKSVCRSDEPGCWLYHSPSKHSWHAPLFSWVLGCCSLPCWVPLFPQTPDKFCCTCSP